MSIERKVILLVDNEKAFYEKGLGHMLGAEYRVIGVDGNHEKALGLVREGQYDLAIIDLSVDTWDGSSLISESREMHPQKPVICFSGWANTRTPEKGIFRIDKSDGLGALVMKIKGLLE